MTIIIKKNSSKKQVRETLKKFTSSEKGLRKHFGKSSKGTDALTFQKDIRNEWN